MPLTDNLTTLTTLMSKAQRKLLSTTLGGILVGAALSAGAATDSPGALDPAVAAKIKDVTPQVVAWRRDIHANPELGNQEFRTSALVAEHLRTLGMEVQTGIANTGVIGILRGGDGPVVALRADMDGLPVTEQVDIPFASKVTTEYNGETVGVMHACGHDNHVAILMGVAEVLAGMGDDLPGTVMFLFQPAEEGVLDAEEWGAKQMLSEGAFDDLKPDVVFGLHVFPYPVGMIATRPEGLMAAADRYEIVVKGRQTHGAMPWGGVDPIVTASQIVLGLQTIASRQVDVTNAPSIISVGRIEGGLRNNIIPGEVELEGTIRTFDENMRDDIHERIRNTAEHIAASAGATAEVSIIKGYPVLKNDTALYKRMKPTLSRVAGKGFLEGKPVTGAEDFSYFANEVPGLFLFLGVGSDDPKLVHPNHSPLFYADERALPLGVTALTALTLDFMQGR
ncbi:amidohydrolase [Congregibacter litoralis]|uniref:Putative carboxypeptidase n=1 Tax=Congregibacter litoralis KT71 TaxID=314285 RepID=A4A6H8_9GAMM|nr:amidohydrolase [Congregibacter litoralis]EAQ98625.1 putative carboxypeptidase [Congregibacter litoralis KT71]